MAQPAADPYEHLPFENIQVDDPTEDGYRTVMDWMHGRNVTRAGGNAFRDIPITSGTAGLRRINLIHAGMPTVSLIIDEKDSYLIAFRRADGQWLHFNDKPLPDVPGVGGRMERVTGVPIQLSSSYIGLIKDSERPYFSVGKHSLNHTYHVLLNYDATVALGTPLMKKQRKALTQLIVMFCEASRFIPIYDLVLEAMGTHVTKPLDGGVWKWIRNWSTLSAFAMHCKEVEGIGIPLDPGQVRRVTECSIQDGDGVASVLRLVLCQ